MPRGQCHHHHVVAVFGPEVPAEAAVEMVSDTFPFHAVELCLREQTKIARLGQRYVLQGDGHRIPGSGRPSAAFGGQDADRGMQSAGDVPRWK